jgi:hypothetical protein
VGLWGICLAFAGCGNGASLSLDENLSNSLRSQPLPIERISEIRVYKTSGNIFLNTDQLGHLTPLRTLSSKADTERFLQMILRGRLPNSTPDAGPFRYQEASYHIIAISADGTRYGYLKARISSDPDKPVVARVQAPDGTGSYEYVALLPEALEALSGKN